MIEKKTLHHPILIMSNPFEGATAIMEAIHSINNKLPVVIPIRDNIEQHLMFDDGISRQQLLVLSNKEISAKECLNKCGNYRTKGKLYCSSECCLEHRNKTKQ